MATKKNMVSKMFMNVLTAGIFTTAFTACHDDLKNEAFDTTESEIFSFTNLEQWGYTVPVKVNVEGDWKIDLKFANSDREFCYAYPDHGHGPATINLCVLDNWTDDRNSGEMTIVDLSNPKNNKVYALGQKCNLDNIRLTRGDDGSQEAPEAPEATAPAGDRNFGVGYGYNVSKEPGNGAISRNPIISLEKVRSARADGCNVTTSNTSAIIRVEQYGASSINELTRKMEISSEIKGSYGGFKAEAKASYSNSQYSKSTNMFGFCVADIKVREAYLEGINLDNVRDFLTPVAKKAVDGTGRSYPSSPEGFKKLINDFGSHLIVKADLGGRLRYGTTCDKQYCKSEEDIKAMASCSYKNKIVDANCKASAEQKSVYEANKTHIQTTISAIGGSFATTSALYGEGKDTDENVRAWMQSLEDNNSLAVVGFGQKNALEMIPLYELIDPDENPTRYNALKEYMTTGAMQDDAYDGTETYTTSDIMKINIPAIDELMNTYGKASQSTSIATLVYEVWDKDCDHVVAMICNEFIPKITTRKLVQTIYPVENNKPNFKAGRFLGDEDHQACNISWDESGTMTISEKASSKGKESTLYLRGSQFFTPSQSTLSLSSSSIVNSTIKGKFLKGEKARDNVNVTFGEAKSDFFNQWVWVNPDLKGLSYDTNYQYPLVKIGNHIWTRENYNGNVPHGSSKLNRYGSKIAKGNAYFTAASVEKAGFPAGWHAGKSVDYQDLKNVISSDGSLEFGARLQRGGVSGFEMDWNGWWTYRLDKKDAWRESVSESCYTFWDYTSHCFGQHHMEYITSDKQHISICDNQMDIVREGSSWAMQIRLVMN